ncbi:unnamed protein product, partial [Rotaria sordida]
QDIRIGYSCFEEKAFSIQINDLRERAQHAIKESTFQISNDSKTDQIESSMNRLTKIISDIFVEITDMSNSMNGQMGGLRKEVLELRQEFDILKQRQMINDHHLLVRELFNNARFLLSDLVRQFYDATLITFDPRTNKWKIRYDDQRYIPHWTIAARIFQV